MRSWMASHVSWVEAGIVELASVVDDAFTHTVKLSSSTAPPSSRPAFAASLFSVLPLGCASMGRVAVQDSITA